MLLQRIRSGDSAVRVLLLAKAILKVSNMGWMSFQRLRVSTSGIAS